MSDGDMLNGCFAFTFSPDLANVLYVIICSAILYILFHENNKYILVNNKVIHCKI